MVEFCEYNKTRKAYKRLFIPPQAIFTTRVLNISNTYGVGDGGGEMA